VSLSHPQDATGGCQHTVIPGAPLHGCAPPKAFFLIFIRTPGKTVDTASLAPPLAIQRFSLRRCPPALGSQSTSWLCTLSREFLLVIERRKVLRSFFSLLSAGRLSVYRHLHRGSAFAQILCYCCPTSAAWPAPDTRPRFPLSKVNERARSRTRPHNQRPSQPGEDLIFFLTLIP